MIQTQATQNIEFAHLTPEAAAMLTAANKIKRTHILEIPFIRHKVAEDMIRRLEEIYEAPLTFRPHCMAIIGETSVGKTSIIREFKARVEEADRPSAAKVPVVITQAPSPCSAPGIEMNIARSLRLNFGRALTPRQISVLVSESLRNLKTRMLIIDEAHNLEPLDKPEQKTIFNMLKNMSNDGIHIVLVGTKFLETILNQGEEQIFSRFRPAQLEAFANDEDGEYLSLLASLESDFPLRQPSNLKDSPKKEYIFEITRGVPGEIIMLCAFAALHAIAGSKDCIELDSLTNCNYTPLPKRTS